jgi:hypothetical protein
MPHGGSSCRGRAPTLLRTELECLYARRSALSAKIKALESYQATLAPADKPLPDNGLEITSKPCNLTTCRNA